jgi:site-specific recombinase XerD
LGEWWPYYKVELGARDVRPGTVETYKVAFDKLTRFVGAHTPAVDLSSEHVEAWRDHMHCVEGLKPQSANQKLRHAGVFFNWLVSEGVLSESPTLAVPYVPVPREEADAEPKVLTSREIRALIAGTRRAGVHGGRSRFERLRDEALVTFMADTGCRTSECAGVLVQSVNLPARQALLHASITKGRYDRTVAFGVQAARLLGRYVREREAHQHAYLPQLWLGRNGALTYSGVYELVKSAADAAGLEGMHPHLLRHSWAHDMKLAGADVEVLMSLGGWTSPTMLARYGRAERRARAVAAYKRLGSPVDRRT